jgi:hypothetical protein
MLVMGHTVSTSRGKAAPSLRTALADLWQAFIRDGSYHPERHYMRGPGPKWRAKHAPAATLASADYGFNGLTTA